MPSSFAQLYDYVVQVLCWFALIYIQSRLGWREPLQQCFQLLQFIFVLWTFFQSRNSFCARYLSTVGWEERARFCVKTVLFVPSEPFALLYFCAAFLAFLPRVCLFMQSDMGRSVLKFSVHVDHPLLLAVVFFFPTCEIINGGCINKASQKPKVKNSMGALSNPRPLVKRSSEQFLFSL